MKPSSQHEREVRAARNRALFRSVNERLEELNDAFASVTETLTIACECADAECVAMLEVDPAEYSVVRADPRHFIVLADHVVPSVEGVVRASGSYVVVEKMGLAADFADALVDSPEQQTSSA